MKSIILPLRAMWPFHLRCRSTQLTRMRWEPCVFWKLSVSLDWKRKLVSIRLQHRSFMVLYRKLRKGKLLLFIPVLLMRSPNFMPTGSRLITAKPMACSPATAFFLITNRRFVVRTSSHEKSLAL